MTVEPIQSPGVNTPASAAPAPATPNAANATPTAQPEPVSREEFKKLEGMAYKLDRLMENVTKRLESVQQPQPPAQAPATPAPKSPAGVEERLDKLTLELEQERAARKEEKLQIAVMAAASKAGVAPERMDYLDYKLRRAHGSALSADGVPDPSNPSARISIETLVTSLMSTTEGAVFKAAPVTSSLPSAAPTKTPDGKRIFKASEFAKIPPDIRQSGNYELVEG